MLWMILLACGGGSGELVCAEGMADDGTGTCAPVEAADCPSGFVLTGNGDCAEAQGGGSGTPGGGTGGTGTGGTGSGTGTAGTGTGTGGTGTGGTATGSTPGTGTGTGTATGTGTGSSGTGTGGPPPCDYDGPWPCNADKDAWADPGFGTGARVGDMLPRFVGVDQFGDEVELWDFLNQGRPVIIQVESMWNAVGPMWAEWLSSGEDFFELDDAVPDAIRDGTLDHVIVLVEDQVGEEPVCPADCRDYEDTFSSRPTLIVADPDRLFVELFDVGYYPWFVVAESDGTLSFIDQEPGDFGEWADAWPDVP